MSAESDVDVDLLSTTFTHNTDLIPAKTYLATAPRIKAALRDTTLIDVFTHYDRIANSKQRLFRGLGMLSLWLAGASLLGIDGELLLGALVPAFHSPEVTASIEICALLSVLIASIAWLAGTRTQWLTARYITETIRQWHFQMFLDGQLMSQAFADPEKFQSERDLRWARLMNRVATAQGEMNSFLQSDSVGLHHPLTPYDDLQTADEAMSAYADLRIDKQLSYFTVSKEKFVARDDISETFARWFLVSALLLAAAQLVLLHYPESETHAVHTTRIILFSCALACVIFTAVIRVYRSALALPQQRERYETKWVRLVALQSAFDAASTIDGKLETMKEVELAEMEEMREFLKEMRRASYIL